MSRPVDGAPWPTATTRPVVVLGWPVRHSLSPEIHNAAFLEHRFDLVYLAVPVHPDDLDRTLEVLGDLGAVGANVTVPHQRAAMAACALLTEEAQLIGAVNTLVWGADGLLGDNTDAAGLRDAVTADVAVAPGDELVVLGTGGAARAAAVAAGRIGASLTVIGRRGDAAVELAELGVRAGAARGAGVALEAADDVAARVAAGRVVINATPLGMAGESLPAPFHALTPDQIAYDLVYDPPETPFLASARRCGAVGHHGLGMLVAQAAASYRRWTGREAPLATMSAVATAALAERARRT